MILNVTFHLSYSLKSKNLYHFTEFFNCLFRYMLFDDYIKINFRRRTSELYNVILNKSLLKAINLYYTVSHCVVCNLITRNIWWVRYTRFFERNKSNNTHGLIMFFKRFLYLLARLRYSLWTIREHQWCLQYITIIVTIMLASYNFKMCFNTLHCLLFCTIVFEIITCIFKAVIWIGTLI